MNEFLLNVLPSIATPLLILAYATGIIKAYRTKDVTGVSLSFWVLINTALLCLFINALVVFINFGTFGYLVAETVNLGLAVVMLIMVLKYRNKKEVIL